jgi:hypothetical protein
MTSYRNITSSWWRFVALVLVTAMGCALIIASGGGGEEAVVDNTPPPPPPPAQVQNGVFKDSNVNGFQFVSGQESGVTDADGRITCETGMDTIFSIGAVTLGQGECATLIMPPSLVASGAIDDIETLNIARFVQMLDQDGDPDNGIVISTAVQQIANTWSQVDFKTMDLPSELVMIISDAASVDSTPHTLPDAATAQQRLEDALACAYAGAFAGSLSGSNSGAMTMLVGFSGASFAPRGLEWTGYDALADVTFFGGGSQSVELSARPTIDHTSPGVSGPIQGIFMTPDRISGTWEGGTFDASRLGGDTGQYRFLGRFSGGDEDGAIDAAVVLDVDGAVVSGEAFEVYDGVRFQVTGSVSGDAIMLTATGGGETISASGTISRDTQGNPIGADGTFASGGFQLSACRLN